MKEEQNITMSNEQDELTIDYQTLLRKFVKHWRWFVVSVLTCLIIAFVYIRYTAPVYNVSASVLIQQKDSKGSLGGLAGGALGMLSGFGGISFSSNFDNEVEIMQSRTLLKKVVTDLGLYISTAQQRLTGYNIPLYKTSPIQVYLSPEKAAALESRIKVKTTYTPEGKLTAHIEYTQEEEEQEIERIKAIMQELPPQCLKVFMLSAIEEKKYTEIADELSISVNTVKTHISKAYRLIRGQLHSEESLILWYWLMSQSTCLKSEMNIRL